MTVDISVEQSKPLERLAEKLPEAAEALTDWSRLAFQWFMPMVRSHVEKQYRTQGAAGGEPWDDYASEPAYAAFKAAVLGFDSPSDLPTNQNRPGGLLRWKGTEWLYPSLTSATDPRAIRRVSQSTGEMAYGTTVPYAERLFEEGGSGPFGEAYPPRPMFVWTAQGKEQFFDSARQTLVGFLRDAGFDLD